MLRLRRSSAFALIAALGIGACTPMVDQRGNLPHPDLLAQIQPGKSTRDDVLAVLGTPSNAMTYGGESWHYISERTETSAFFEPKVTERKVVTVVFDGQGVVRDVVNRGLDDGKAVQTVERATPTAGKEMSILEQLIGNVGRFSKMSSEK